MLICFGKPSQNLTLDIDLIIFLHTYANYINRFLGGLLMFCFDLWGYNFLSDAMYYDIKATANTQNTMNLNWNKNLKIKSKRIKFRFILMGSNFTLRIFWTYFCSWLSLFSSCETSNSWVYYKDQFKTNPKTNIAFLSLFGKITQVMYCKNMWCLKGKLINTIF